MDTAAQDKRLREHNQSKMEAGPDGTMSSILQATVRMRNVRPMRCAAAVINQMCESSTHSATYASLPFRTGSMTLIVLK